MAVCYNNYETCLGTTDCSLNQIGKKATYVQCPKYSYWNKTKDDNKFKDNCKFEKFKDKSCNFWGNKDTEIKKGDDTYIKKHKDTQRCKQLQTYALDGKWDEIIKRLNASIKCPKNKQAYITQIKYLLCQLQNCRTRYYEDSTNTINSSKNPFTNFFWKKKGWKHNIITLISLFISGYFFIIGAFSAIFKMDGFNQAENLFRAFGDWCGTTNIIRIVLLLFGVLFGWFLVSYLLAVLIAYFQPVEKDEPTVSEVKHHKLTNTKVRPVMSRNFTDGIVWENRLFTGILIFVLSTIIVLCLAFSYWIEGRAAAVGPAGWRRWPRGFLKLLKYFSRLVIIVIIFGVFYFYVTGKTSIILDKSIIFDKYDKYLDKTTIFSENPKATDTTNYIEYDKTCDSAKQINIDTNNKESWAQSFKEILFVLAALVVLTFVGKRYVNGITQGNFPALRLLLLLIIMPFSLFIVPIVISLNFLLGVLFIKSYPVFMILQRFVVGVTKYYLSRAGRLGFRRVATPNQINTYLRNRTLGWDLLFIPLTQGISRHLDLSGTTVRAAQPAHDISGNTFLFGPTPIHKMFFELFDLPF